MKKGLNTVLRLLLIVLTVSMFALAAVACSDTGSGGGDDDDKTETVTLNASTKTIERYEDFTLVPTQSGSGELEWLSSDPTVASVDGGKVMGLKEGSAVITVRVKESPESKAECGVTVTDNGLVPTLSFGDLTELSLSLLLNDTYGLEPTLTYNKNTYTDVTYAFSSSAEAIATVSSEGVITAVAEGSANITVQASWRNCTAETLKVVIPVEVKLPVQEVDLTLTAPMDFDMSLQTLTFDLDDLSVEGTAPVGTIYETVDKTDEEEKKIGYDAASGALTKTDLVLGERVWGVYAENEGTKVMYRVPVTVATKVIATGQDLADMYTLGGGLAGAEGANVGYTYDGYFVLAGNIDCTGTAVHSYSIEWTGSNAHFPEAGFHGTFDGRGYTISNLTVGDNGVFGILGKNSLVKNVAFTNITTDGLEGGGVDATESSQKHPAVLAERIYGEGDASGNVVAAATVQDIYITVATPKAFWSTIMEFGNYSFCNNLVLYAPDFWNEEDNAWAGGGPLGQLVGAWTYCTARTTNCLLITDKKNAGHQPEETCPGLKEFHDGMTIYDPATYMEDGTFLATDFTELYDCTDEGIWTIDSATKLPVFKTSVAAN